MPATKRAKAQELISQLEQHQHGQIQCLQALLDFAEGGEVMEEVKADEKSGMNKDGRMSSESSKKREITVQIPDEWAMPWSNNLLRHRIEEREKEPGCGGGLRRNFPDVGPEDPAARFIAANALNNLANFKFEREAQFLENPSDLDSAAFYVIDYDRDQQISLDTRTCSGRHASKPARSEVLRTLFRQRTIEESLRRVIVINAVTPSALSTVLICAAKDKYHDYATIYAALRRYLSTSYTDRHYNESHTYVDEGAKRHITAFTLPYFSLTEHPPAVDYAPLSRSGIFGIDAIGSKYIREEKFSLSWSGEANEPSLMVALNPLMEYGTLQSSAVFWVRNNIFHIRHKWEEVLDSLDEQTTLSSSITFDSETIKGLFFDDRNFTNSKRYFWALQSLRLSAEHIDGTLRSIPNIYYSINLSDGLSENHETVQTMIKNEQEHFGKLRDRVERKRQEIQGLSEGLYSASSVAEGRLTSEQNGNIRLLTLVTIAYIPLVLGTSIYSMDALPKSAGLVSYVVVTILMCAITYVLVFNLRHLKEAISWGGSSMRSILFTRRNENPDTRGKNHRAINSATKRASTIA